MRDLWRIRFDVQRTVPGLPWPRAAGEDRVGPGYRHVGSQRHPDEACAIQLGLSGFGMVSWRGKRWRIGPGEVLVTPVGDPDMVYGHDGGDQPWHFTYIACMGVQEAICAIRDQRGPVLSVGAASPLERLLSNLSRQESRSLSTGDAALLVTRVIAAVLDGAQRDVAGQQVVLAARTAVRNDPAITTVTELAQRIAISREHLSRVFYQECGVQVKAWLHSQRIEAVREQLIASEASLADIAKQFRFGSVGRLCQAFAAIHGETPARYRRIRSLQG